MSYEGGGLTDPSLIDVVTLDEQMTGGPADERSHVDLDYDEDWAFPGTGRESPMPRMTQPGDVETALEEFAGEHDKEPVDVKQTAERWRCGTVLLTYAANMLPFRVVDRDEKRYSITVRNPLRGGGYTNRMMVGNSPTMNPAPGAGTLELNPGESHTFHHSEAVYCIPDTAAVGITYLCWSTERSA